MSNYCDMCEGSHNKKTKAVWKHSAKNTEKLCDKCYKDTVKFYSQFVKIKEGN